MGSFADRSKSSLPPEKPRVSKSDSANGSEMLSKNSNELSGDWARFERAVDAAVKSGPKHKITPKAKERPASKGRVHKGKTRN